MDLAHIDGVLHDRPVIDWAVMQDPFGNEFCLVHDLTLPQSLAAIDAAERGATTDHELRLAAGLSTPTTNPTRQPASSHD